MLEVQWFFFIFCYQYKDMKYLELDLYSLMLRPYVL